MTATRVDRQPLSGTSGRSSTATPGTETTGAQPTYVTVDVLQADEGLRIVEGAQIDNVAGGIQAWLKAELPVEPYVPSSSD